jgi:hypothetical protein
VLDVGELNDDFGASSDVEFIAIRKVDPACFILFCRSAETPSELPRQSAEGGNEATIVLLVLMASKTSRVGLIFMAQLDANIFGRIFLCHLDPIPE